MQNINDLLEHVDDLNLNIENIQKENLQQAIFSHYLHNHSNGVSLAYKDGAFNYVEDLLQDKNRDREISEEMAKSTLSHILKSYKSEVPFPAPKKPTFKFIDLFAGIGGFRLALQNLKGKCVYTSEWNTNAQYTYKANFGEIPFGDITEKKVKGFIPEKFDVLCAGFPCQAFSIAGYRKGFSDTRGTLFFDVEQIIAKHRPKVVFLENVKNLVSHDKGNTFKIILEILEQKLGYKVFHKVLNSMTHANVPQNRERIFIVAFDPDQVPNYSSFKFPEKVKLTKTIHDFIDYEKQEDRYYYSKDHKYYPELDKTMTNPDTMYQWRRVYVRENKSNVCPTLTANMGTGGHNVPLIRDTFGIRKLTPKECFALQGYPMDSYVLPSLANSKLYMQAGNSVTTTLIQRIGKEILNVL
ncbi:DNA cytosine methyltransferase [Winogradskyella maritima]|uniref:Cytosine-specific methyltransferase n=1 Tax=Winogradskyella maritima TaxID=1517766 RepID=A0ABV8AEE0_9FLAO|nr:DNA cytosine methyltransferase [Winogradskyella maritima]